MKNLFGVGLREKTEFLVLLVLLLFKSIQTSAADLDLGLDLGLGLGQEYMSSVEVNNETTAENKPGALPVTEPEIPVIQVQFQCLIPNGLFPDPTDCGNFYLCINSQHTQIQCLPGFGFDPTKGYCAPRGQVSACVISNILDGLKCPSDGFQPNRLDCTQFYWCYQGSAVTVTCPLGMHFDKKSKLCLPAQMATCSSLLDP